jgi:hypothetical protein
MSESVPGLPEMSKAEHILRKNGSQSSVSRWIRRL